MRQELPKARQGARRHITTRKRVLSTRRLAAIATRIPCLACAAEIRGVVASSSPSTTSTDDSTYVLTI